MGGSGAALFPWLAQWLPWVFSGCLATPWWHQDFRKSLLPAKKIDPHIPPRFHETRCICNMVLICASFIIYSENWPDSLNHSCVRLPARLKLLCAAWCGIRRKIDSAPFLCRANQRRASGTGGFPEVATGALCKWGAAIATPHFLKCPTLLPECIEWLLILWTHTLTPHKTTFSS